jgi:hypothetical protein
MLFIYESRNSLREERKIAPKRKATRTDNETLFLFSSLSFPEKFAKRNEENFSSDSEPGLEAAMRKH